MLHGAEDPRVSRPQAEAIYANLPGDKELHFFDGLGHESYAAERPDEWKEWVRRFAAKVRGNLVRSTARKRQGPSRKKARLNQCRRPTCACLGPACALWGPYCPC